MAAEAELQYCSRYMQDLAQLLLSSGQLRQCAARCDMALEVDLFWSFRSPYSYLALTKTSQLLNDFDVAVNARPVYPLAVRDPTFFKRTNALFARYVVLDSIRVAQSEGIPLSARSQA